jgi:HlyD family secretion protein
LRDPKFDDDTVLEDRNVAVGLDDAVDFDAMSQPLPRDEFLDDEVTRVTPPPELLRPPMIATGSEPRRPSAPLPGMTAARRSAPMMGQPAPMMPPMMEPARTSSPMVAQYPTRPSNMFPTRAASPTPSSVEARLASLSLDKGQPMAGTVAGAPRRSSKLPWLLLVLVVAGGGFYHYTTVRDLEKTPAPAAPAASGSAPAVGRPSEGAPSGSLLASGYIAAKQPIVISATSSGRLQEVRVDAGATITKGQVLAVIDDSSARAEVGLAAARVHDADRAYKRQRMLQKAQAATPVDVERAMGALEVARGEYGVAAQKLDQTRIKSPIDGTVLEVLTRAGETITLGPSQSAGILKIADLTQLDAEADVAETELKGVHVGQPAEITSDAQPGRRYRGTVREIGQQADRARGTVLVKVDILGLVSDESAPPPAGSGSGSGAGAGSAATPAQTLKPGMAIQVRFLAKT